MLKELSKVFVPFELHKESQKLQKRKQLKSCVPEYYGTLLGPW